MPNVAALSGGKYKKAVHMDAKEEAEQYIRKLPVRSAFVAPGLFMSNYQQYMKSQPSPDGDESILGDTVLPLIDIQDGFGKWVTVILADFDKYDGVHWSLASGLKTNHEIAQALAKHTGKTVKYQQLPVDVFCSCLLDNVRHHLLEMWLLMRDYGYFGPNTRDDVNAAASHARARGDLFCKLPRIASN